MHVEYVSQRCSPLLCVLRCCLISSSTSSTCTSCCCPALNLSRSYAQVLSTPTGSLWYVAFRQLLIIAATPPHFLRHYLCSLLLLSILLFQVNSFRLLHSSLDLTLIEAFPSLVQGLVLFITIMREAIEEIRCYLRDKEVNSQVYSKLSTRGEK